MSVPEQLSLDAARKKLGLSPTDHARDYLPQWQEVAQKLEGLAHREQDEEQLQIYQRDLASLRQVIEMLDRDAPTKKKPAGLLVWGAIVLLLAGSGIWAYQKWGKDFDPVAANAALADDIETVELVIGKRRWDEAETLVSQLRARGASKQWVRETRIRIFEGREAESGQQLGYFIGGAQAALEARRIDEAKSYLEKARGLSPESEKLKELAEMIQASERDLKMTALVSEIEQAIQSKRWATAEGQLVGLAELDSDHEALFPLQDRLREARQQELENRSQALVLLRQAQALDQGEYSAEALRILEQAMRLNASPEVRAAYQRMSAYGRVMLVPAEFPTIAEALTEARARDRIQVSAGTYQESLLLKPGVVLVGEGKGKTIIECQAAASAVLSVNESGPRARVASMTLRHQGLVNEAERFSVVAVEKGGLRLDDVNVAQASGHGIAVVDGGQLSMIQGMIERSGWDGISVQGEGSVAELRKVTSQKNLHHGIDFWDGASGSVEDVTLSKNGRAGLVVISNAAAVKADRLQVTGNRELGVFVAGASEFTLSSSAVTGNALGGIILQDGTTNATISNSRILENGEAGLIIERGSQARLEGNEVSKNKGRQLWQNAVFPSVNEEAVTPPPVPAPPQE